MPSNSVLDLCLLSIRDAGRSKMPQYVLMMIAGWKMRIPDTYFQTLGEEDAVRFHREMSPADKWGAQERNLNGATGRRMVSLGGKTPIRAVATP